MSDVLPPQAGLNINNVYYRYTVNKRVEDALKVHVQNINKLDGGFIFSETDDWTDGDGGTVRKSVPVQNIPREYWGTGQIVTEGEGTVSDPYVRYGYIFDPCYDPMSSPDCPGYEDALYQWLLANGQIIPEVDDPYNSSEVQNVLNNKAELDDEEETKIKEGIAAEEDDDERRKLASNNNDMINDAADRANRFFDLAMIPNFDNYYDRQIPGGAYDDVVQLQDSTLPDNRRAMSSLAQDSKFESIVRSQYDR